MATVRTSTKCSILATLNKEEFKNVMRRAQKRRMAEEVEFLKNFTLFSSLSNFKLQKLFYLLKEVNLLKNTALFKEDETPVNGVYLIKQGEIAYHIKH